LEVAKDTIVQGFRDGFDVATEQVKVLYPDLDLSIIDPSKMVVKGHIVAD